jgi:hypothetical protein
VRVLVVTGFGRSPMIAGLRPERHPKTAFARSLDGNPAVACVTD